MCVHKNTLVKCTALQSWGPPNDAPSTGPLLFIKTQTGAQTEAGWQWKAAETESSSLSGWECGSLFDGVGFWRKGGAQELTLALSKSIERHPPTNSSGARAGVAIGLRGTRYDHHSNLLSGRHRGEVRGQISAVSWKCFLMIMPSQTALHHSRTVGAESHIVMLFWW